ncbi:MAG: response regulator, partial [Bdellovibrionales bacterium]|nr:response regulator [Bdellovibrionales bacterium]
MARILLVDDDRDLLEIASALLVHAGHSVVCRSDVLAALDQARKQSFDVVITDANMSPHSGFDLIRSLKQMSDYELTPIAMLTGRREKRDVERAISMGAKDYIIKPLEPARFLEKVAELVAQSDLIRKTSRFAEVDVRETALCEVPLVLVSLS